MQQRISMSRTIRHILLIFLFAYMALCYAQKIAFITADLGRHIKNGEVFFQQGGPIFTNHYSYTEPDFPVVTHHWGAGVIYYLIWKRFDFAGLSLFNAALYLSAFFFFFRAAEHLSNFKYALFFSLLSVPLITSRIEIRPEAFSVLFMGAYYYLLCLFRERRITLRRLSVSILLMQLFWVNLHLFFVMGWFLIGAFLLNSLAGKNDRQTVKQYSLLFAGAVIISLVNPFGIRGLIEPLMILREYGYMIAENQTIAFMQHRFPGNPLYAHYELLFIVAAASFILLLLNKQRDKNRLAEGMIMTAFTVLAWRMIRGIPAFGFFFVPIVSANTWAVTQRMDRKARAIIRRIAAGTIVVVIPGIFLFTERDYPYYHPFNRCLGLGLGPGVNRSAEFFKGNNIQGPVFNNYDIGGYLIFHLFPRHKVFVDNRPESYSVSFFKDIYEPMQADERKWEEMDKKYNFNCIYFYRHDITPNAQPFLLRRINDPRWAAVYVDDYTLILVKRNAQNKDLVRRNELPRSLFRLAK